MMVSQMNIQSLWVHVTCFKPLTSFRSDAILHHVCLCLCSLFETNERLKHLPMKRMQEDSLIPMVSANGNRGGGL